ncbi:MAG: hypothetical protein HOE90_12390, partial [Bacteriovoracaceae bacterium]|nr:hypothetical protein [Bacteriovoracaceae bacterium]
MKIKMKGLLAAIIMVAVAMSGYSADAKAKTIELDFESTLIEGPVWVNLKEEIRFQSGIEYLANYNLKKIKIYVKNEGDGVIFFTNEKSSTDDHWLENSYFYEKVKIKPSMNTEATPWLLQLSGKMRIEKIELKLKLVRDYDFDIYINRCGSDYYWDDYLMGCSYWGSVYYTKYPRHFRRWGHRKHRGHYRHKKEHRRHADHDMRRKRHRKVTGRDRHRKGSRKGGVKSGGRAGRGGAKSGGRAGRGGAKSGGRAGRGGAKSGGRAGRGGAKSGGRAGNGGVYSGGKAGNGGAKSGGRAGNGGAKSGGSSRRGGAKSGGRSGKGGAKSGGSSRRGGAKSGGRSGKGGAKSG